MPDQPLISIIIVSWNVRKLLLQCLASIERYVQYPHQVIIVDNASWDNTVEEVKNQFPDVEVHASNTNLGFSRANNVGLKQARGQFVAFLNPDTELINEPFLKIIEYFHSYPKTGCIGPEIINPDRSHQQSVRHFPGFADQALTLLKLRHLLKWTPPMRRYLADPGVNQNQPLSVDQVMGAAMVFPKKVIDQLSGFDDRYWIWFEEVDLCQRVKRLGLNVIYFPGSQIVHHGNQSFSQVYSVHKHRWFMQSLHRYTKNYWTKPQAALLVPFMVLSFFLTFIQTFFKPK